MQKTMRKMGMAMGAALAAVLLFGLGKVWAGSTEVQHGGAAQKSIEQGSATHSDTVTQDDGHKNWRKGRRH